MFVKSKLRVVKALTPVFLSLVLMLSGFVFNLASVEARQTGTVSTSLRSPVLADPAKPKSSPEVSRNMVSGSGSATTTTPRAFSTLQTAPDWTLVWSDEFDGPAGASPAADKWNFEVGGNGWGNNELQSYTLLPSNAALDGQGHLNLTALAQNYQGSDGITRNYTSARLNTNGKFSQAYGRIEARLKLPAGQGLFPAFWLLNEDPDYSEIDIMENVGQAPSTVWATTHDSSDSTPGVTGRSTSYTLADGKHFADDFHIFALEWEPNVLRWYVDGNLYGTVTPANLPPGKKWVFDQPMYIVLNVAIGGSWAGSPDSTTNFPQTMQVDYVRVYQPTGYAAFSTFANKQFKKMWEYSDKRVAEIANPDRGYTWGPNSSGILSEIYQEARGGTRQVQYFDKSRMELTNDGNLVTNGLLTKELVTGKRQDGNAKFIQQAPSQLQIAGDSNTGGANDIAPTYASFTGLVTFNSDENRATEKIGQIANLSINRQGQVGVLSNPPAKISIGNFEPLLGHNVPEVFVKFQEQVGLVWNAQSQSYLWQKIYTDNPTVNVFGYPISEAYWTRAVVAGVEKDVLVQLFERRVLTYTPSNSDPFKVEMGNIGRHYYSWRYQNQPVTPSPDSSHRCNYYVAPNGSDTTNTGSQAQPWRTIQKAADNALAGCTVYVRGGVYAEMVTLPHSGNSTEGYITFQNYPDEVPVLDGTGLQVPEGVTGAFLLNDRSYLSIQGFEIRNFRTAGPDRQPAGIYITGQGDHLQILNNQIHQLGTDYTGNKGGNAHGIAVYGTNSSQAIHDLKINGNQLYNLKLGFSEALVLNGNVENFEISNNSIHENNNIGIDIIGFEGVCPDPGCDQARKGVISGNTIFRINSAGNPAYGEEHSAAGIYVDGGREVIIERNIIYESDYGIELASERGSKTTSFVTARSNLIYHNLVAGILIGGYDSSRGGTNNCQILNNTLFQNDTSNSGAGEFSLQYNTRDNIFKNNLLYAGSGGKLISNEFLENSGNQLDYNLYYAAGDGEGGRNTVWQWKKMIFENFAEYQKATGNDPNSLFADPLFADNALPDYKLKDSSTAINAGENLSNLGDYDLFRRSRLQGGRVDIGAIEIK